MNRLVGELAAPTNRLVPGIYIAHALVELVLGALKLRGSYAGLTMPDEATKFARHHGMALLALALLSGECARRGLTSTAAGGLCSLVLCFFHTGAVAVMTYDLHLEAVALHVPFAAAFAVHAAAMSVPPDKEH
jgi:hypothetical protein